VAELRGVLKVVTNDRQIHTFAEGFLPTVAEGAVNGPHDEFGLAGLCLDPENGYVFVTFSYADEQGIKNGIGRFETAPGVFATRPDSYLEIIDIFDGYPSGGSHVIGGCQVSGEHLFVGVGDGLNQVNPPVPLEDMRGKILRLTLDGDPAPTNPFYEDGSRSNPANYVWALGLRNPFGIKLVGEELFAADNGQGLDRFVEIAGGEDYLWNGRDQSLLARANLAFSASLGPAQIDYVPPGSGVFPEKYENAFYLSMTNPAEPGIKFFRYDFEAGRALSVPEDFLRYIAPKDLRHSGSVTGLALGPDGLYFAPLLPSGNEIGAVYRISYDPANGHPHELGAGLNALVLIRQYDCLGCHSLYGEGGSSAPSLDRNELVARLDARLNSPDYLRALDEADRLQGAPYEGYQQIRADLRAHEGDERIRLWITAHIVEPKFDDPDAQMPTLGVSFEEAQAITDHLLSAPVVPALESLLALLTTYRYAPFVFLGGFLLGAFTFMRFSKIRRK
jgi:hypothetical protein